MASAVLTRAADQDTDDRDLVVGVRAGDDRAFELLFQRYQPRITAYVRGMVHDHGRAEDITQEVFMSALRRMREETEREILFKPWIYEIAKNRCIDVFRRGRATREVSLDAEDAIGADDYRRLAGPGATPDSAVEGKVAIDNLCGAFGGLSPVHHDILVLREFDGLSYREIGDRLGMSRPAVESTLFRARKRLSEEYEELVSGERCLCVRRIVDASDGGAAGLRDQRRMARHIAHCQPCRRYARAAGIDLGEAARPAAAAARIAAFLPLPAFLRKRWGGDETAALLGQHGGGGSLSHLPANLASVVDPAVAANWAKAVATAATVAVAGVGAGAAFTDRLPLRHFDQTVAPLTQPSGLWTVTPLRSRVLISPGETARLAYARTVRGAGEGRVTPAADRASVGPIAAPNRASAPLGPAQPAAKRVGRYFDSLSSAPPAGLHAASGGDGQPGNAVAQVLDTVGLDPAAAGAGAATVPTVPGVIGAVTAPAGQAGTAAGQVHSGSVETSGNDQPAATAGGDTVSPTVTETITKTTSVLSSLGS